MTKQGELLVNVAHYVTVEMWKRWREDVDKCLVCHNSDSLGNGDELTHCQDHQEWQSENESFDILITRVYEEFKNEKG